MEDILGNIVVTFVVLFAYIVLFSFKLWLVDRKMGKFITEYFDGEELRMIKSFQEIAKRPIR